MRAAEIRGAKERRRAVRRLTVRLVLLGLAYALFIQCTGTGIPYNSDVFPNSGFDGNMFEWIGYNLVTALAGTLTCGIAVPWVVCSFNKWYAPNARISGHRLRFDGSGAELFGQYFVVLLLSIVTCGLYAPWGFVKLRRWYVSHVRIADAV